MTPGCSTCGGARQAKGTAMACPACSETFERLVAGPVRAALAPSPVFPDEMDARCINGHIWRVTVLWEPINEDPLMQWPARVFPPACPFCGLDPRGGLQHIGGVR